MLSSFEVSLSNPIVAESVGLKRTLLQEAFLSLKLVCRIGKNHPQESKRSIYFGYHPPKKRYNSRRLVTCRSPSSHRRVIFGRLCHSALDSFNYCHMPKPGGSAHPSHPASITATFRKRKESQAQTTHYACSVASHNAGKTAIYSKPESRHM